MYEGHNESLIDCAPIPMGYATLHASLNLSSTSHDNVLIGIWLKGDINGCLHISKPIGMNKLWGHTTRPLFLVLSTFKGLPGALHQWQAYFPLIGSTSS